MYATRVCVHVGSSAWRKDMVTPVHRFWCEKGKVWAGGGGKKRGKGGEPDE